MRSNNQDIAQHMADEEVRLKHSYWDMGFYFEEKKRGEISHEKTPRIFDEKRQDQSSGHGVKKGWILWRRF